MGQETATHTVIVKAYIWREGHVLLLKRHDDDDIYPGFWDTPGGGLYKGESALDGLKREIREETSLLINKARPISTWSHGSALGLSFLATDPGGKIALSDEHTAFAWADPGDLSSFDAATNLKKEIASLVTKGWTV